MNEMLMVVCWLVSFAGQLWGWLERQKVPCAFAPLAVMSTNILCMYAGGMLGMLHLSAWLVMVCGLALFVWMLVHRSRALLRWELLVFVLLCAALYLRYRPSLLTAYDDFSHWGMIVRHMLLHDRLPAAQDALITFQSYPPGAACWIYSVCRFLGGSDGMMLTAQAWLTLAGWFALLGLMQNKSRPSGLAAAAAVTLTGLSMFQGTASLMVDNVLPAMAVGAVCFVVSTTRRPWLTGMLAASIALVKDSGLFFAAILLLWFAACVWRANQNRRTCLKQTSLACIPALIARGAWMAHVKLDFPAAAVSRHALTVENLRATGADKSYADMLTIGKQLLFQSVHPHNQSVQILLLMLLTSAVIVLLRRACTDRWSMRAEARLFVCCTAIYAAWTGFLWLMYVFSMPLGNSLQLVAYQRYNSTCALFLYGVWAAWLIALNTPLPKRAASCIALAALLPLLGGSWTSGVARLLRENYHVPLRNTMEVLSQQRMPQADETAAVVIDCGENGIFAGYMARYVFQAPQIIITFPANAAQQDVQLYYIACETEPLLPDGREIVRRP